MATLALIVACFIYIGQLVQTPHWCTCASIKGRSSYTIILVPCNMDRYKWINKTREISRHIRNMLPVRILTQKNTETDHNK